MSDSSRASGSDSDDETHGNYFSSIGLTSTAFANRHNSFPAVETYAFPSSGDSCFPSALSRNSAASSLSVSSQLLTTPPLPPGFRLIKTASTHTTPAALSGSGGLASFLTDQTPVSATSKPASSTKSTSHSTKTKPLQSDVTSFRPSVISDKSFCNYAPISKELALFELKRDPDVLFNIYENRVMEPEVLVCLLFHSATEMQFVGVNKTTSEMKDKAKAGEKVFIDINDKSTKKHFYHVSAVCPIAFGIAVFDENFFTSPSFNLFITFILSKPDHCSFFDRRPDFQQVPFFYLFDI